MSFYPRESLKRKNFESFEPCKEEDFLPRSESPKPPKMHDQEKRLRREVANSNERRRMQSINAGFQSLRNLIPHNDGEKLSKAAILQQTVGYIAALEADKTRLLSQNNSLHQLLRENNLRSDSEASLQGSPPPKRKKRDTESSDEGIGMTNNDIDEQSVAELRRDLVALRKALDRERCQRMVLEERNRELETQAYSPRIRQVASQVQAEHYEEEERTRYLEEQRRLQELEERRQQEAESERQLKVEAPPPTTPLLNSSKASRNMEILLEAFRLIEGDHGLFPSDATGGSRPDNKHIPKKESCSSSDIEDSRSDLTESSSGRDSPMSRLSDSEGPRVPVGPIVVEPTFDSRAPLTHSLTPPPTLHPSMVLAQPPAHVVPCLPSRHGVIIHGQTS